MLSVRERSSLLGHSDAKVAPDFARWHHSAGLLKGVGCSSRVVCTKGRWVVVPLVLSGYTEGHDGRRNDPNPKLPPLR